MPFCRPRPPSAPRQHRAVPAAVDALAAGPVTEAMVQAAVTAIVLSGVAKAVSGAAKELQMVVFTPLAQAVGRQVAFSTFK